MNYMEHIAKLLAVEFEEVFKIRVNKAPDKRPHMKDKEYKLTPEGLFMSHDFSVTLGVQAPEPLARILNGDYSIIKLPWMPKAGERYYYCTSNNSVRSITFEPHYLKSALNIKVGNCFKTKEEAEQHLTAFKAWLEGEPITDWRNKL